MKYIYCGSVQRFIDLIEWKYEVQLVLKRGQLKIFQSNKRRNPGLLGDYSRIHDANHVQVWCRRHLQNKKWVLNQTLIRWRQQTKKMCKLFQFAASFLLAIIRWTQQTNKCAKLCKFSVFLLQVTWLLKLGSRIDWQLVAVSSNPMILKHSLENSTIDNHDREGLPLMTFLHPKIFVY